MPDWPYGKPFKFGEHDPNWVSTLLQAYEEHRVPWEESMRIETSICRTCGQHGAILNNFGECQDCTKKRAAKETQDTKVSEREKALEQLVRDWSDFVMATALSTVVDKDKTFKLWNWNDEWVERHNNLENRSKQLLNEGKVDTDGNY
jgi:hypothetical protein